MLSDLLFSLRDTVSAFLRGSYGHYKVSSVDVQHSVTSGVLQLIGAAPYYDASGKYNPLGTLAGSYFQARDQISKLGTIQGGSDLTLADNAHFRFGLMVLVLLGGTALLARLIGTNDTARLLHPMLGLLALVLSGLQIFFGMPMLPL